MADVKTPLITAIPLLLKDEKDCAEFVHYHASAMEEWPFYGEEGCYKATLTPVGEKPGLLARLFCGKRQAQQLQFSQPQEYTIDDLKKHLCRMIDAYLPVAAQFHEPEVLKHLLAGCETFAEIIAWGCLTGACSGGDGDTLPALCENADDQADDDADEMSIITAPNYNGPLSPANIRLVAQNICPGSMGDTYIC